MVVINRRQGGDETTKIDFWESQRSVAVDVPQMRLNDVGALNNLLQPIVRGGGAGYDVV
jgi:hypothetical protein